MFNLLILEARKNNCKLQRMLKGSNDLWEVRLFSKHNYLINNCLLSAITGKANVTWRRKRGLRNWSRLEERQQSQEDREGGKGREIKVMVSHV